MTNETRKNWIDFLAWGAGFTLFISLVHPWVMIITALLAIAAAVIALFND